MLMLNRKTLLSITAAIVLNSAPLLAEDNLDQKNRYSADGGYRGDNLKSGNSDGSLGFTSERFETFLGGDSIIKKKVGENTFLNRRKARSLLGMDFGKVRAYLNTSYNVDKINGRNHEFINTSSVEPLDKGVPIEEASKYTAYQEDIGASLDVKSKHFQHSGNIFLDALKNFTLELKYDYETLQDYSEAYFYDRITLLKSYTRNEPDLHLLENILAKENVTGGEIESSFIRSVNGKMGLMYTNEDKTFFIGPLFGMFNDDLSASGMTFFNLDNSTEHTMDLERGNEKHYYKESSEGKKSGKEEMAVKLKDRSYSGGVKLKRLTDSTYIYGETMLIKNEKQAEIGANGFLSALYYHHSAKPLIFGTRFNLVKDNFSGSFVVASGSENYYNRLVKVNDLTNEVMTGFIPADDLFAYSSFIKTIPYLNGFIGTIGARQGKDKEIHTNLSVGFNNPEKGGAIASADEERNTVGLDIIVDVIGSKLIVGASHNKDYALGVNLGTIIKF